jgi:CDP-glucose 4,6-dehydratase
MLNKNFWQRKKVLVTGHTGFKGSWLSLWLQALQADVIGYALPPDTTPNLFSAAAVANGMTSIIGDIRDYASLHDTIRTHSPEIIIHMAAQPLLRQSYDFPVETYATNVMGTVNLLEAARQVAAVKVIVNVTSDKCYENQESNQGYTEKDSLGGYDPYSNSKACAELVTAAYRNSFLNAAHIGVATARAGNVIGGGDWVRGRLVPDIMRAHFQAETLLLRYPNAVRPWQHVLNPLAGYLRLAEKLYAEPAEFSGAWNFGPEEQDAKTVNWIYDYLTSVWQKKLSIIHEAPDLKRHETSYLKLDSSKAKKNLQWQPHWHLEKALHETAKWYQAFQESKDMRRLSFDQIEEYKTRV